MVSAGTTPGSLQIDQDATSFVSRLQAGHAVRHASRDGRQASLFVIEGVLRVNGMSLAAGDQARIAGERTLRLEAAEDAEVILLDLP
ncbi:MAG TPA: hypothetical protein VLM91_16495 [Candidatus Methylomirabilis sp.]|nr:hypothetical protein [Candidatus Methylomirabilis sp.]